MKKMLKNIGFGLFAALLCSLTSAMAETVAENQEAPETAESVVETINAPESTGNIIGSIEVRPSMNPNGAKDDEFHTENNVILGYKFNPKISVMYRQEFNTNLFDPTNTGKGLAPIAKDGIIIGKFNDIWTDAPSGLAFGYEPRLYLPTDAAKRDAGMISAIRQYLKLTKVLTPEIALTLMETPIIYMFDRAGVTADGTDTANSYFENRVYAVADFKITTDLALSIPLIWNANRFGQYGSSVLNNSWQHTLWAYPELTYAVTPNFTVGAAFATGNMLAYDSVSGAYKGLDIESGLGSGTAQLIINAAL